MPACGRGPTVRAMYMDDGWWIVMMVGMFLFWTVAVLAIVWLVRELAPRRRLRGDDARHRTG